MADRVEISNLALSLLGEDDQLEDPLEDSKPARSIRSVWNMVRDAVLRAHLWNFAVDPAGYDLTADGAYVASQLSGWRYRFRLPEDFIRLDLQRIVPRCERNGIRCGNMYLHANIPGPLHILYVRRVDDPGEWDASFVQAFAARLAWQVADRLTGDRQRKNDAWNAYLAAVREARGIDGRENPPEPAEPTGWEMARFGWNGLDDHLLPPPAAA